MKLLNKTTLTIILALITGTSVLGDQSDFFNHQRGDEQWFLSSRIGQSYKFPSGTHIPHMEFNAATVEIKKFTSPITSIGYELSIADQTNNSDNNAISVFANYTKYLYTHNKLSANCKFGLGVMHLKNKVRGQATKTNFNEQICVGIEYATNSKNAITLECVLYHASNAGIERPNHGINATAFSLGYSWRK